MSKINYKKLRTKSKLNYELPVVVIHRTNKHAIVQVLEPITKKTLVTIDSYKETGTKKEKSVSVGEKIGKFLNSKNYDKAIFDRNGFVFTGRVQAVVEGIKKQNIII